MSEGRNKYFDKFMFFMIFAAFISLLVLAAVTEKEPGSKKEIRIRHAVGLDDGQLHTFIDYCE